MNTHRGQSKPTVDHRAEIEQFYCSLFAEKKRPAAPVPPRPARPFNPANPEEISTEEFFRQLFARDQDEAPSEPQAPAAPAPGRFQEMSTEEFFRELFATPEKPLALGPRPGLEPPALPARFRRVRGGNQLVSYELLVDEHGRIAAKHENVAGNESYFIYEYDATGHLLRAWRDGSLAEEYAYDPRGARVASWNARDGQWKYGYDERGRLASAGPWRFAYADDGSLREAWTPEYAFRLPDNQDGGQPRTVLPGGRVLRSETVAPGLPTEKYIDAAPVESFTWRSPLQLATYRDYRTNVRMRFHYTCQERLPQAVTVQDQSGTTTDLLGYDQVGSLKAVAAMDGEHEGRVVKVVDYDAFGNVLADSNPGLFLPLSFAGGLRDRFTGLVRFCHRDYDPTVGRFTAPDPLGDTGGDHDLYDYCVDEPVGRVDPEGLEGKDTTGSETDSQSKSSGKVTVIGSISGGGLNAGGILWDDKNGWFPDQEFHPEATTDLIGGGLSICKEFPWLDEKDTAKVNVNLGIGRHLGVSTDSRLSKACLNIGAGLGLPLGLSGDLEKTVRGVAGDRNATQGKK